MPSRMVETQGERHIHRLCSWILLISMLVKLDFDYIFKLLFT